MGDNMSQTDDMPKWYVVHTYSGYENKVKANIEKIVENRGMQEQILEISVPVHNSVEVKNGVRKNVVRKVLPGYVLVHMHMNDDTWYVVRNTRGVTSFVGPGSRPVALSDEELKNMGIGSDIADKTQDIQLIDAHAGDYVRIVSGPFQDATGTITEVNHSRRVVIVSLSIFGRETPVELDYTQIEKN